MRPNSVKVSRADPTCPNSVWPKWNTVFFNIIVDVICCVSCHYDCWMWMNSVNIFWFWSNFSLDHQLHVTFDLHYSFQVVASAISSWFGTALVVEGEEGKAAGQQSKNKELRMPLFFKKRKPSEESKKRLEYQLCRVRTQGPRGSLKRWKIQINCFWFRLLVCLFVSLFVF